MSTGQELIDALKANLNVMAVNNCPGASVVISEAVYGKVKDDRNERTIDSGAARSKIESAIYFEGGNSKTAVWHFMTDPVHHFVVIPWHKNYRTVYTVFMAYENQYTINEYVQSARGHMAQSLKIGYKDTWTPYQLSTMLSDLLTTDGAWGDYFFHGNNNEVNSITYYKYDTISLTKAIANVA